jgi:hypothetical protein
METGVSCYFVGPGELVGTFSPQGFGFADALPDALGAAVGDAEAVAAGVAGPPMLQGLGFDDALAEAIAAGLLPPGLQPPSAVTMESAANKKIGRFITGFLQFIACMSCSKDKTNNLTFCRPPDTL